MGELQQTVGKRTFAVINVSDNAKITNVIAFHAVV
jgi:hypothetical protein